MAKKNTIPLARNNMEPDDIVTDDFKRQKDVAFYAAAVNAWFNTSIEHDKRIITLAASGVGLLVTLITVFGVYSILDLVLYIVAIIIFLATIILVLYVFRLNRIYIEKVLNGTISGNDHELNIIDRLVLLIFTLGVFLTMIIGIYIAIHSYTSNEDKMSNKTTESTQAVPLRKSFNGAHNLKPFAEELNPENNLQSSIASTTTSDTSTPASATSNPQQNKVDKITKDDSKNQKN